MMKGLISLSVTVLFFSLTLRDTHALTYGVKYTVHNLGSSGGLKGAFYSDDTSEVCVFCHTPHNSVPGETFLWNRLADGNSPSTFKLYTGSRTLTPAAKSAQISKVSKMCMSCHDGVTAINSLANGSYAMSGGPSYDQMGEIYPLGSGVMGPNIGEGLPGTLGTGGDLTNDHPISFNYADAQGADNTLKPVASVTAVLPLWNGNVECVTCHDPHVNYGYPVGFKNTAESDIGLYGGDTHLAPFLRRSNATSGLCFVCHDK